MIAVFVFIIGICLGSFLNCVIYRLSQGESFLKGRSRCPKCRQNLEFQDLIPFLSFFLLRGRCRYCQGKISWQYPLVELATGILFILSFNLVFSNQDFSLLNIIYFCYFLTICSCLVVIFFYDLNNYIIPDSIILPIIVLNLFWLLLKNSGPKSLINPFFSGFFASLFFLFIFLVSKGRWLGLGDVKLAFFMGLFLGFPKIILALFSAFLSGAIIGLALIVSGRKKLKDEVPFGPFLVLGTIISLFWGQQIINFYLGLLL